MGDLYILESDNNRILKFSLTGEYMMEIGANDAGEFALNNPLDFCLDKLGDIYVLDDNTIKIFDQYGNVKTTLKFAFNPINIEVIDNSLLLVRDKGIIIYDIRNRSIRYEFNNVLNNPDDKIMDAKRYGQFIYILTSNKIIKFKIQS
jgi:hypothetical protein